MGANPSIVTVRRAANANEYTCDSRWAVVKDDACGPSKGSVVVSVAAAAGGGRRREQARRSKLFTVLATPGSAYGSRGADLSGTASRSGSCAPSRKCAAGSTALALPQTLALPPNHWEGGDQDWREGGGRACCGVGSDAMMNSSGGKTTPRSRLPPLHVADQHCHDLACCPQILTVVAPQPRPQQIMRGLRASQRSSSQRRASLWGLPASSRCLRSSEPPPPPIQTPG